MRLLFATTNSDKLSEAAAVSSALGVVLVGLRDFMRNAGGASLPTVAEVGATYYENARAKALAYSAWSGEACVADDSGIEIHSLGRLPGVYTAGFGFSRVRDMLVPNLAYEATFRCCMCFADASGRAVSVEAALAGALCFPRGATKPNSPTPYSQFFTPHGETRDLSTLCAQRGFPSHRAKALRSLLGVLEFTDRASDQGL